MKMLKILNVMDIEEDQQVWSLIFFLTKKAVSRVKVTSKAGVSVNKQLQLFSKYFETFYVLPNFPFTTNETMRVTTYKHSI